MKHYVFNIYEVLINNNTNNLILNKYSNYEISIDPINAFGMKIPFKLIKTNYNLIKGKNKIQFIEADIKNKLIIQTKGETGEIIISIDTKYQIFPNILNIFIIN